MVYGWSMASPPGMGSASPGPAAVAASPRAAVTPASAPVGQ